jgi:IclR family transcriptional regulator, acetate operon repressor
VAPAPNTSVDQIFDALDLLATTGHRVGVAEMARQLDLPTSTAHRLLVTLEDAGFAGRDLTGAKYELGARAHRLVHALFAMYPIQRAATPFLARLADETGETMSLDVRVGWVTVRMAGAEGWHDVHAGKRMGEILPLGGSASGLAILAFGPDRRIDEYLAWESRGKRQARRTRALRATVAEIRGEKYSRVVTDDRTGGQLAFPVSVGGEALAAVSISGGASALTTTRSDVRGYHKVVSELEALLERNPAQARDPFAHLSHDELTNMLVPGGPLL